MKLEDVKVGETYLFTHKDGIEKFDVTVTSVINDTMALMLYGTPMVEAMDAEGYTGLAMPSELSEL